VVDTYMPKMEAANRRAIQLDPNYPGGYLGLATFQFLRGNFLAAQDLVSKALALDPSDPRALGSLSFGLAISGNIKKANAIRQQSQAFEPFVPWQHLSPVFSLGVDGQNDAALSILTAFPPDTQTRATAIAMIYASLGRYGEAADLLEKAPPGNNGSATPETVK